VTTVADLVRIVDEYCYQAHVSAFVCTPATFHRLKVIALDEQRERMRQGIDDRHLPPVGSVPLELVGIPVRVEDEPDPQLGEVLLTLP
jgi:hypothetical protein